MEAKLYYLWNDLDSKHQFFLVADNIWIWYYLGMYLGDDKRLRLYPFEPMFDCKLLKHYKYNGCKEIAQWIAYRIKSKIKTKPKIK